MEACDRDDDEALDEELAAAAAAAVLRGAIAPLLHEDKEARVERMMLMLMLVLMLMCALGGGCFGVSKNFEDKKEKRKSGAFNARHTTFPRRSNAPRSRSRCRFTMLARAPSRASMSSVAIQKHQACPNDAPLVARRGINTRKLAKIAAKGQTSNRRATGAVAASSASSTSSSSSPSSTSSSSTSTTATFDLACPICYTTRFSVSHAGGRNSLLSAPRPTCPSCGRTFDADADFLDLTPSSGVASVVEEGGAAAASSSVGETSSSFSSSSSSSLPSNVERYWGGTQIFRSPLVAAAYDNGWRAGFAWAGFPGADDEFDAAMARIAPVARGKIILDLSCGSGLFARRFVKSGLFSGVIAADYSEAMLRTAAAGLRADGADPAKYLPLRLDAARLPFANNSLAAVHAGAAIHCWPAPALAVAEVARVLEPGGVFVASTFLDAASPLEGVIGESAAGAFRTLLARPLEAAASRSAYRWWTEGELRGMCSAAGLVDFRRWRSNRFILFSAKKRMSG